MAGSSLWVISSTAAMCMAVGKVSLDDWDMLTSSLGWTGSFEPITPPAISMARLEITSLAFMLDWVPLPVCHTLSGKWSLSLPSEPPHGRRRRSAPTSPATACPDRR